MFFGNTGLEDHVLQVGGPGVGAVDRTWKRPGSRERIGMRKIHFRRMCTMWKIYRTNPKLNTTVYLQFHEVDRMI